MADLLWSCRGDLAVVCDTGVKVLGASDGSCKFSHAVTNKPQEIQPGQEFDTSTLGHGVLCCFSNSGKLFALCTPQKELLIWHTNDWKLLSKREVVRRTTVILFTNEEDYIIAGNKGGEVYRFSILNSEQDKELLLGHVSMILDMVITKDDKFLITSDRDEKIRVSCYPNCYNIRSFCLGSLDFVSCLTLLPAGNEDILISGGGDGFVRFWNPKSGEEIISMMTDDRVENNKEENLKESLLNCPAVSRLACCHKNSVVCAVKERCRTLCLYHTSVKEVISLPALQTCVPPWSAAFDPEGRLWCIQPHPEEPVLVFEPRGALPNLTYVKLSSDFSPVLLSASDWNFLKGCVDKERKLDTLRKKEVDNISDYFARKEDRIGKKKGKSATEDNTRTESLHTAHEEITESHEAKRPRLET